MRYLVLKQTLDVGEKQAKDGKIRLGREGEEGVKQLINYLKDSSVRR